jgi:hypothetical protein
LAYLVSHRHLGYVTMIGQVSHAVRGGKTDSGPARGVVAMTKEDEREALLKLVTYLDHKHASYIPDRRSQTGKPANEPAPLLEAYERFRRAVKTYLEH